MKPDLTSLLVITSLALSSLTTLAQGNAGTVVPDHYIVELQPGTAPAAVAARHGVAPSFVYDAVINGFAGFVPPGILRHLQADPQVARVVPDREVAAIGKPGGVGQPTRQPQVIPAGVNRIGAPALFGVVKAVNVGVAVVDTGLDMGQPDLNVSPASFNAFSGTSGDDDNGHGTHVGGIIAAKNDAFDVVGVAPDATLYAVKVLNSSGSGSDATVLAGLNWVVQNYNQVTPPIRVVNMSLGRAGSYGDNPSEEAAVAALKNLGITVVVAAGNDCGADVSWRVPACYPEVIAVASTTALTGKSSYRGFAGIPADTASTFTTDGAGVAISAPGEDQENVSRAGFISSVGILSTKVGGGTTRMSGTSMASPHVAGVAALIYAADSTATPDEVRSKILSERMGFGTVPLDSPTSCYSSSFDGIREGVVSAAAALAP